MSHSLHLASVSASMPASPSWSLLWLRSRRSPLRSSLRSVEPGGRRLGRALAPAIGDRGSHQEQAAEQHFGRRGSTRRIRLPRGEVLSLEDGDREHADHRNRHQPSGNERERTPPAPRHAQQDDHRHNGYRAREGRSPDRAPQLQRSASPRHLTIATVDLSRRGGRNLTHLRHSGRESPAYLGHAGTVVGAIPQPKPGGCRAGVRPPVFVAIIGRSSKQRHG
jgi:hypothetical protein